MIIDRDSGFLNEYFNITKGQLIDLYHFCTLGEQKNDQEETWPVRDGKTNKIIYVPERLVKRYKSGIVEVE